MKKIQDLLLLLCAAGAVILAINFFSHPAPINVDMPRVTEEMVEENKAKMEAEAKQKAALEAARKQAEIKMKMYKCTSNDECIIVDQDPCGCLRGPKSVTAINSNFSLEFSRMMEKKFAGSQVCPDKASTEKECSRTARAVCQERHCKIIY